MKYIRKILLAGLILCGYQYAYADGGTWRTTCKKNVECPAGQTGYITLSTTFSNSGGMKCDNRNIYWGNAKQTANTCVNSTPIYKSTQTENRANACFTGQVGQITQTRTYEIWSDDSKRNYAAWGVSSNTCAYNGINVNPSRRVELCQAGYTGSITYKWVAYYSNENYTVNDLDGQSINYTLSTPFQHEVVDVNTCVLIPIPVYSSTEAESRVNACFTGQFGGITQTRKYELWSDGSKQNYTAWEVSGNTCSYNAIDVNKNKRKELCQEGYTGSITYKWVADSSNENYTVKDLDGQDIKYNLSTPFEREVLDVNACVLIPSNNNITTTPGSITVTCDSYYGVAKGTYQGEVIKYGNYVTSYSSATKQTTTNFVLNNNDDVSSCKTDSTISAEKKVVACPDGENGEKIEIRYVAVDGAGQISYPYGAGYKIFFDSCMKDSVVDVPKDNDKDNDKKLKPYGLLENVYVTSSNIINDNSLSEHLKSIKSDGWISNEKHKLTIEIDDLTKNYNPSKVSSLINLYESVVGDDAIIKVVLPKNLAKLVGNGPITKENVLGKKIELSNIRLVGNNAVVTYLSKNPSGRKIDMPIERTVVIPVFDSGTNTKNVKF